MPRLTTAAELRAALPRLLAPAEAHAAIGLAVSGGADSLALLLLVAEWASHRAAPKVFIYSVDHGLRPEAAGEVAFVLDIAARLGLPARGRRWDGDKPSTGVQAAARAARYQLMGEAMRADGATLLLTAHHAGDQAETVLMRLAHGSGLGGLRGIEALSVVEGVPVFRPFLEVPREVLRAVGGEAGLTPAADPSNADTHYERVRWRAALPALDELGLHADRIGQFARRAGEADAALTQWAEERFAALVERDAFGAAALPQAAFAALPVAVRSRLLARLLDTVGGGQKPRALGQVERLAERLGQSGDSGPITLLGTSVSRRGDMVWFSREPGRSPLPGLALPSGEALVWDRRFAIVNHTAAPLGIRMAREFSRAGAEQLLARRLMSPSTAIRSAPLVTGADGTPMALGCLVIGDGVSVNLTSPVSGNS